MTTRTEAEAVAGATAVPKKEITRLAIIDAIREFVTVDADERLVGLDDCADTILALTPAVAPDVAGEVWRCFHCDDVFTDKDAAREHFGDQGDPACKLNAMEGGLLKLVRDQEDELQQRRQEDTASYREFHSLGSDHARALQHEEEKGYARGLADG